MVRGLAEDGVASATVPGTVLVVDLDSRGDHQVPELHPGVAAIVVGRTSSSERRQHESGGACDVLIGHDDVVLHAIVETAERNPLAATALAVLLRTADHRSIDDGLSAESAVYSSLQAGPEFAAWRASRPPRARPEEGDPVLLERHGPVLTITLNRPHVRNALNTAMRDQLVEAFRLPSLDPGIDEVHLRGAGEAFCSGGDLDEFGSFIDPASAHLIRLQQSVGRWMAASANRVTAHLHGACVGSGVELPAFARRVVAHPSTEISLPELSLGLIPGAGGTVSLPQRIGRHRTARLALTGETIDATTALRWGLVDAIQDDPVD